MCLYFGLFSVVNFVTINLTVGYGEFDETSCRFFAAT